MKHNLKFDVNGNFKIVQFTDLHEGPVIDKTIEVINKVLDCEQPDLVVLTGDIIDGQCKTVDDVKIAIHHIAKSLETRCIPWCIVFGNHDDEHNMMTKEEMMRLYMSFEYNISEIGYKTYDRIGNYNLTVESSKTNSPMLNIYMLDSGKYAPKFMGAYNWIKCTQIWWYKRTASKLKRKYNRLIPAIMFFHIPLPEFRKARKNGSIVGKRLEEECCPLINTRLFRNVTKIGDVKGIFVGHDHLNNYYAILNDIKLGYGNYTGYGGYGSDELPRGARVFLINESEPANFRTWIA